METSPKKYKDGTNLAVLSRYCATNSGGKLGEQHSLIAPPRAGCVAKKARVGYGFSTPLQQDVSKLLLGLPTSEQGSGLGMKLCQINGDIFLGKKRVSPRSFIAALMN